MENNLPRVAVVFLLLSSCMLVGCGLPGFLGFVIDDQERQERGQKTSEALMVKLRNADSGEFVWCQEDWTIWFWLRWAGDEVQMCKEFYIERGFEPVATLISHIGWIVDINTANSEDLVEVLNDLNTADAQAIVNGQPYRELGELVEKGILSTSTYELVKRQIKVGDSVGSRADTPISKRSSPPVSEQYEIE